jgi:hypothetical protein
MGVQAGWLVPAMSVLAAAASFAQAAVDGSEPGLFARGDRARRPKPTPRRPDGRVNLSSVPGQLGWWLSIDARTR